MNENDNYQQNSLPKIYVPYWLIVLLLFALPPLGLILMWLSEWSLKAKNLITLFLVFIILIQTANKRMNHIIATTDNNHSISHKENENTKIHLVFLIYSSGLNNEITQRIRFYICG